jgi:osmotically-inducible protein OsmY
MKIIQVIMMLMACIVLSAVNYADTTITNVNVITNPPKSTARDDDIVSAIYTKYAKNAALIGTSLTVGSQNGIVTISGNVTAQSQADAAIQDAKSIAGVKDVRSTINVTTNPKPAPPAAPKY